MEEMLPRALDGLSLGSIQGLNFYADTAPPGDSAPATVSMIPQVFVNGLGIRYDVHTSEPALLEPPYFRGHTGSKEFHVKPCQFGDFISTKNLRRFPVSRGGHPGGLRRVQELPAGVLDRLVRRSRSKGRSPS
jgi:hypothetical protein